MKKHFISTSAQWLCALLCLFCLLGITACATTRGTADTSSIVGKWFFDYRDNQDSTTVQIFDFKADGTITGYLRNQDTYEYDKGTYWFEEDGTGKPVFVINFTQSKLNPQDSFEECDLKTYYNIEISDDDLVLTRFKRDFTAMGGDIQTFDPPTVLHFYRMKNVKAKQLTGTWSLVSSPELFQTFGKDGTFMTVSMSGKYPMGTFELIQKDNATGLRLDLTQFKDTLSDEPREIPDTNEYFYDIWLAHDMFLIQMQTGAIIGDSEYNNYPENYSVLTLEQ